MKPISKISFVIPCYRSEKTIGGVIDEIESVMKGLSKYSYEIICVNDGSPDNTGGVLEELSSRDEHIVFCELARNFGQDGALMAGFHLVSGDLIICLDDDGQNPAEYIPDFINKIDEGYDLVFAKYRKRKFNWIKNAGSAFNRWCSIHLTGTPKDIYINSYFAARRYVIEEVRKTRNPAPYVLGQVSTVTRRMANIDVEHRKREVGHSNYSMSRMIKLWADNLFAFSIIPIQISRWIGVVLTFFGFIFLVYTIIMYFFDPTVPLGWSSLMSVMLIFGGIILLAIGIMGEYIGRIYMLGNKNPQFVVREVITKNKEITISREDDE